MTRTPVLGFTLVEMAVVLALLGLILGVIAIPLSTQLEQQRIRETQRQLELTREAIFGFALATGRLPCAATPTTPSTTPDAGTESCPAISGVVPWTTLGVSETDAWGSRFTYRVTASFASPPPEGAHSSFALTDSGDITVTNGSSDIAKHVPAIVVSHGINALGAYRSDGSQVGGAMADESENADGDARFVSRGNAPDFDDLLVWLSGNVLKSRMVAGNRLP